MKATDLNLWIATWCTVLCTTTCVCSDLILENSHQFHMNFFPDRIEELKEKHLHEIRLNYSTCRELSFKLYMNISHPHIAELSQTNRTVILTGSQDYPCNESHYFNMSITPSMNDSYDYLFKVKGLFLGRTYLQFFVQFLDGNISNYHAYEDENEEQDANWTRLPQEYHIAVVRDAYVVDGIFTATVIVIVFFASIGVGCKMDLHVLKKVFKKPIGPAVGLFSQFVIMPLLGFALAKAFKMDGSLGFGLFAMACAPGGGASNMYTVILDGDVDLSVAMTLISTIASLGMVPLWLFTLGQSQFLLLEGTQLNIPYQNIMISLASVVVSVGIGVLIKYKRPAWAEKLTKFMKPLFILLLLVVFTFGVWANLYIFYLFAENPISLLAGCLLPWGGFLLGGIFAWICRQDFKKIKTIAIETGIQNSGVPIILMKVSLPQPDADISIVPPIAASSFTPIPLFIAIAIHVIYRRYNNNAKADITTHEESLQETDNKEDDKNINLRL